MAEILDFSQGQLWPDAFIEDGLPPDHAEREKALDITQSWIVEAPAGSGKTGLLIQRYLKLLTDEEVTEPDQVLAITFTEKATSEIRERVLKQLEAAHGADTSKSDFDRTTRALAQTVVQRDAALGWGLLERPHRLKVRTIDSVCSEIARSLPVLSGAGGAQAPVTDASPLYREAARRTLMQLGGGDALLDDSLRVVLLHRDGNLGDVERLIAEMLQWRDQWGELIPLRGEELNDAYLDGIVLPKLEKVLEREICAALIQLSNALPLDILNELSRLAGELGHGDGYRGEPSPIAMCAGMHDAPGETAEHLHHWRALIHLMVKPNGEWRSGFNANWMGFHLEKKQVARLKELVGSLRDRTGVLEAIQRVNRLPPAQYPEEQWRVAKALFRVLGRALAELQLIFAERSECDFAELGLLARAALRSESSVDALEMALGLRYRHMLVDEMQDTSTSQYELIELLTQGWHGGGQTVFLVGDPKQSIYLFRQARVERFIETMQTGRIGDLPLGCLRLTANFRSQSGLVSSFNESFSLLFPKNTFHAEEVPYVEASAIRGPSASGANGIVWHAEALPAGLAGDRLKAEKRRRGDDEARAIRTIVEEWRVRSLPAGRTEPWKIAVLVQNRSHLRHIVAEFRSDRGSGPVPFRAIEIEELGERPEVLDLFALTRALLHPADRVAWLAVLHAPWCGLGLAELHLLAGKDDPDWAERSMEEVIAERGHDLSEASCERLERLWEVLQAAAKQRARVSLSQWVERTWRSLGGDAYLSATEMVNARRYFELLDELEQQTDGTDLLPLQQRLKKLYAEPETGADAVDLVTIHRSKGLEWDVVMVPGLEKQPRMDQSPLLTWGEVHAAGEDSAQMLLAPIAGKGEDSKELNQWLNNLRRVREAAERKRLFYVACTRAREELHLFAAPTSSKTGEPQPVRTSLLNAAWPAAQPHFAPLPAPAEVVTMAMPASGADTYVGDLAAREQQASPMLERLPLTFVPRARFHTDDPLLRTERDTSERAVSFVRPEGSFEARAMGNAIHALLEVLAGKLAHGVAPDELLTEVANWGGRMTALLRGEGLPSSTVERLRPRVAIAIENTLRDDDGRWLLAALDEAASEYGLISWEERRRSVRMDRIFRAGEVPLASGRNCLWIVDYKTTVHGLQSVERFLEDERKKYGPQMEAYARMVQASTDCELRLGLYYPMLPKLVWWKPENSS